jgi:hypothetical protein
MKLNPQILNNLLATIEKLARKINQQTLPKTLSTHHYYSEHRSISICLPRQFGNTELALKLFKKHPDSILITNTYANRCCIQGRLLRSRLPKKLTNRVFSINMADIATVLTIGQHDVKFIITNDCSTSNPIAQNRLFSTMHKFQPIYINLG